MSVVGCPNTLEGVQSIIHSAAWEQEADLGCRVLLLLCQSVTEHYCVLHAPSSKGKFCSICSGSFTIPLLSPWNRAVVVSHEICCTRKTAQKSQSRNTTSHFNVAHCIGAADKTSDQGKKTTLTAPKMCPWDRLPGRSSASSWESCPCPNIRYNNGYKDKKELSRFLWKSNTLL